MLFGTNTNSSKHAWMKECSTLLHFYHRMNGKQCVNRFVSNIFWLGHSISHNVSFLFLLYDLAQLIKERYKKWKYRWFEKICSKNHSLYATTQWNSNKTLGSPVTCTLIHALYLIIFLGLGWSRGKKTELHGWHSQNFLFLSNLDASCDLAVNIARWLNIF